MLATTEKTEMKSTSTSNMITSRKPLNIDLTPRTLTIMQGLHKKLQLLILTLALMKSKLTSIAVDGLTGRTARIADYCFFAVFFYFCFYETFAVLFWAQD